MAIVHFTSLLCLISHQVLTGLKYHHTTFQRFISGPTETPNRTSAITTVTAATRNTCLNTCHNQRTCLSVVFDETSSQCYLYNTDIIGGQIGDSQDYYVVRNKTIHEDVIAYAQNRCRADSPGYIYNATVPLCYKIDVQPMHKTEAESFCNESGGHLLRINTERKQRFVQDLNLTATDLIYKYRIDGRLSDGIWTFADGTPITKCYWYPGEPKSSEDSIALTVGWNGKWDGVAADWPHGKICEKDLCLN